MSLGDFDTSAIVYGKFTTYRPSTGAAYTLAGTPALSVYKDNSVTQSTTGVTLTADFDSVTGLNHFAIDTSADGTFYATGSFFDIVITTGTVDSISVVGAVVGSFTLRKDSGLKPTTAGRTLDVSAGGEAGLDWANVGSPTTAVDLTNTTIKTTQKVDVDTIKTNPVVNGGTITFPTTATLASTTNITAGTITTTTNLTNAPTAGDLTATMKTSVQTAADAAITASAKTGSLTFTVANQLDVNVLDWKSATAPAMTGDAFARLGAPAGASVSADVAAVKVDTAAVKLYPDRVVGRVTVSGTAPSTTSFTASTMSPSGVDADQFKGRILVFDNTTTTTALQGQATDITANTGAALPVFTYTALTSAPQSGDTASIV